MTTTQGLTSPHRHTFPVRHPNLETALALLAVLLRPIAEPFVYAISPERIGRTIRVLTALVAALTVVALLTACKAPEPPIPTITPAVQTTPTPVSTPSATTWEQVGA